MVKFSNSLVILKIPSVRFKVKYSKYKVANDQILVSGSLPVCVASSVGSGDLATLSKCVLRSSSRAARSCLVEVDKIRPPFLKWMS